MKAGEQGAGRVGHAKKDVKTRENQLDDPLSSSCHLRLVASQADEQGEAERGLFGTQRRQSILILPD